MWLLLTVGKEETWNWGKKTNQNRQSKKQKVPCDRSPHSLCLSVNNPCFSCVSPHGGHLFRFQPSRVSWLHLKEKRIIRRTFNKSCLFLLLLFCGKSTRKRGKLSVFLIAYWTEKLRKWPVQVFGKQQNKGENLDWKEKGGLST